MRTPAAYPTKATDTTDPKMKELSTENTLRHIDSAPMFKALVPFVAGIALAEGCSLPLWGVALGFVVCAAMARLCVGGRYATIYILASLILAGAFAGELRSRHPRPSAVSLLEIKIEDITSIRENITLGEARVVAYIDSGSRVRSGGKVRFVADSALRIEAGERLLTTAAVREFDTDLSYGRYMWRRGFMGQLTLHRDNTIARTEERPRLGLRLRTKAVERIARLGLRPDAEAIAQTIGVGERSRITPSLRANYTHSGAAHLLAVSGLHIGFLCVVANLLLWWLPLVRRGHIVRSALIVGMIWLYAAVVGFTPSVTRAATMFTIMQVAINTGSLARALNTLCFTAFVMLAWDAGMIHDAGFLLSFLAVFAILEWGVPLTRVGSHLISRLCSRLPKRRRRWVTAPLRGIWSAVVVSTVAAVATTPLAASLFGTASLWSVVVGPAMVALSAVAVATIILWVVMPIAAIQGLVGWLVGSAIGLMNGVAEWCARSRVMAFEWDVSGGECAAIYILFGIITLGVWAIGKKY